MPSERDKNKDIKQLRQWLSNQKTNYKNKDRIMNDETVRKLYEEFIKKYQEYFISN